MDATVNDFLNEINEIVPPVVESKKLETCEWQECFDESSGFPYYWNMSTNSVTWEMPDEYKNWLKRRPVKEKIDRGPIVVAAAPKAGSVINGTGGGRKNTRPARTRSPASDEERIILISSYGGDTESEDETQDEIEVPVEVASSKTSSAGNSDGEAANERKDETGEASVEKKPVTGFSLLAAYEDASEDEEPEEENATPPASHSTLFPVVPPIDLSQFTETEVQKVVDEVEVDAKAFQRKRRIAVDLINAPKRNVASPDVGEIEGEKRAGLGFEGDAPTASPPIGGKFATISFVRTEVLNPEGRAVVADDDNGGGDDDADDAAAEQRRNTLAEKLTFLSEGREPTSAVQVMLIQLQTLHAALKAGALTGTYLSRWLNETCAEIVKLEEDGAPDGWLLQWDRSQKRYYYRNRRTETCQWDYPEKKGDEDGPADAVPAVVTTDDDAMDICTTPPPQEDADEKSSSPPPGPETNETAIVHPPGIENEQEPDLNSVLSSFYSDIAAIENGADTTSEPIEKGTVSDEPVKKKKKVKLSQGTSLKKKNVSKLVEKWKNVQRDLE